MMLRSEVLEALRQEVSGQLKQGDHLVMIGPAGLSGTGRLIQENKDQLEKRFSAYYLRQASGLAQRYDMRNKISICLADVEKEDPHGQTGSFPESGCNTELKRIRASAFLNVGEGGFLCALWMMAETSGCGLRADLRKVPVLQETIEFCEVLGPDPYRLEGEGAVLVGTSDGYGLVSELKRNHILSEVFGTVVSGNDRLLYSGGITRYLDRPGAEELKRLCSRHGLYVV